MIYMVCVRMRVRVHVRAITGTPGKLGALRGIMKNRERMQFYNLQFSMQFCNLQFLMQFTILTLQFSCNQCNCKHQEQYCNNQQEQLQCKRYDRKQPMHLVPHWHSHVESVKHSAPYLSSISFCFCNLILESFINCFQYFIITPRMN